MSDIIIDQPNTLSDDGNVSAQNSGAYYLRGATFTPSVSEDGVLSWTNDKGLSNPTSRNIKGPKGSIETEEAPITDPDDDTVDNWLTVGSGVFWYDTAGQLKGQPEQWGFLVNCTNNDSDVFQVFHPQSEGDIYYRSGNASGWSEEDGSWTEVANADEIPTTAADLDTSIVRLVNGGFQTAGGQSISMGARIATGSYIGTGNYGASNPNSLTFDFEPKMLFIGGSVNYSSTKGTAQYYGLPKSHDSTLDGGIMLPISLVKELGAKTTFTVLGTTIYVTLSGNTVSWYSTVSADAQHNDTDKYWYIAIG